MSACCSPLGINMRRKKCGRYLFRPFHPNQCSRCKVDYSRFSRVLHSLSASLWVCKVLRVVHSVFDHAADLDGARWGIIPRGIVVHPCNKGGPIFWVVSQVL